MAATRPAGPPPVLEVATLDDVDGMVDVFMDAFDDDYFQKLFPPDGRGQNYLRKAFRRFVAGPGAATAATAARTGEGEDKASPNQQQPLEKQQECRVMVIKDGKGTVQSVIIFWLVHPGDGGMSNWESRWPPAGVDMDAALLAEFFTGIGSQHEAIMKTKEHIFVEIVMTHSSARRLGHASALLAHGNDLADAYDYQLYLDARPDAMGLYRKVGYVHRTDVVATSEQSQPMVRPNKSSTPGVSASTAA